MSSENYDVDAPSDTFNKPATDDWNESSKTDQPHARYTPTTDSNVPKGNTELKQGQQHGENIISKAKRVLNQHCKLDS